MFIGSLCFIQRLPYLFTMSQSESNPLYVAALRMLARRDHSVHELRQKLQKRFPQSGMHRVTSDEPNVQQQEISLEHTIQRLQDLGYLDDQRYVQAYIDSRVNRGLGSRRIAAELQQRGIPQSTIDAAVDAAINDEQSRSNLYRLWQKKYGTAPVDLKEKGRQARFFQSRGFSLDEINRLFAHLSSLQSMD